MNKTINQINDEYRSEYLSILLRAIDNGTFEELDAPDQEWEGEHVIITSDSKRALNPKIDEDDGHSRKSGDTYVVTRHSLILSKLFGYVKEKKIAERDSDLYGFMAFLANDFISEFGDLDNYDLLLDYMSSGISFYMTFSDYKNQEL